MGIYEEQNEHQIGQLKKNINMCALKCVNTFPDISDIKQEYLKLFFPPSTDVKHTSISGEHNASALLRKFVGF